MIFSCLLAFGQDINKSSRQGSSSFGLGLGLSYGGIGIKLGTNIANHTTLFGGVGYQIAGAGYNFGLLYAVQSASLTEFYLIGMYGTNAGIISDGRELGELFTGPTFGVGIKVNSRKKEGNFWDIGVLVPIKSQDFYDRRDDFLNNPFISGFRDPSPIQINIGYNFDL